MVSTSTKQKISFSAKEKELLVFLIKNEKIIEDMRTNKSTNKLKAEAWDRITKSYNNNAFVTKREAIQLRRCWEKIKRMTKDGRSKEIRNTLATGGGSPPPPNLDYVPGVDEVVPHLMYEIPRTVDIDTFFEIERQAGTATRKAPDVLSTRQENILREREQQEELFLLRRSILLIEKEQASENLRHHQKINNLKEVMEAEKLDHQRALWKIELKLAFIK